jgi:A/G-specific adenine glycosylase
MDAVTQLLDWFDAEGADLPWRRTRDRYAILVSEIMLQATPVARVLPYYEDWMARWPTAKDLARASLGDILVAWHGLGYPRRAKNLHRAATIVSRVGWPDRLEDLPGVGAYTAAAIRCFADEEAILPVDTNIQRVLARRWPGGSPDAPPGKAWHLGQALMDFGRLICTSKGPACEGCPVRSGCPAADSGRTRVAPARGPQGRYAGSMRQRRGVLLRALADHGRADPALDPEAAESLVADGLARRGKKFLLRAR